MDIGAGDRPIITLLNKADLVDEATRAEAVATHPGAIIISTITGEGLPRLLQTLEDCASENDLKLNLFIPHAEYSQLSKLYASASILSAKADEIGTRIVAVVPERLQSTFLPWAVKK